MTEPVWIDVLRQFGQNVVEFVNNRRLNEGNLPEYIQFNLPSELPMFPPSQGFLRQKLLGQTALSLLELESAFQRIAMVQSIQGVILVMPPLAMPLADATTLRDSILRLRSVGKRVIAYSQGYDNTTYYVASACDSIWIQRGGVVTTLGILQQQNYLKDALDSLGIETDVVAVTPYKSAADRLSRREPSEEVIAQTNWLLDSLYDHWVGAIANGRKRSDEDVRQMIDNAPYTDKQVLELGYVDMAGNEEDFGKWVNGAKIELWENIRQRLPLRVSILPSEYVAVVPLSGTIVNGTSAQPPVDIPLPLVGGDRIGDVTVVNHIRTLMQQTGLKAVVFHIDSPGGSASASEAIASAMDELAKKVPVVVCMGAVSASGGYYIATSADSIIAQPATVTGSIGVISAKLTNTETLKKLRFNPFYFMRGKNADMFAPIKPFTDEQREKMRDSILRIYETFVERVANARKMKPETVDSIGGGRVWTGIQARDNGLVDQLGGLYEAIEKARELAKLPKNTPVQISKPQQNKHLVAQLAEQANPASAFLYWFGGLNDLTRGQALLLMPEEFKA